MKLGINNKVLIIIQYDPQIEEEGCIKLGPLDPGTPYSISIRAHNSYGWSSWSGIALVKTTATQSE